MCACGTTGGRVVPFPPRVGWVPGSRPLVPQSLADPPDPLASAQLDGGELDVGLDCAFVDDLRGAADGLLDEESKEGVRIAMSRICMLESEKYRATHHEAPLRQEP
jgi:hypothetical protein